MKTNPFIYLFSDATGATVEKMADAALTQFQAVDVQIKLFGNLRTRESILAALNEVERHRGMVVYTVVNQEYVTLIQEECEARNLLSIDLFTPMLMKFSAFLEAPPKKTPGLFHGINDKYYKRIEAVEFSVKHDDGQEPRTLHLADIVLVGVSRTSKTPLSMYLANSGWKVANVPIVKGIKPPEELFGIDPSQVVGLLIDPKRLMELRIARLKNLKQDVFTAYADFDQIVEELEEVKTLYRQNSWTTVNVSGKAVEETANEVLFKMKLK
ncbi:MAG: kinase/pyrophosphorylase [Deltaproteobacteria bacterium]|nr:kinase/pyrophosphorylase [Deltaproteobacteria bacterium]